MAGFADFLSQMFGQGNMTPGGMAGQLAGAAGAGGGMGGMAGALAGGMQGPGAMDQLMQNPQFMQMAMQRMMGQGQGQQPQMPMPAPMQGMGMGGMRPPHQPGMMQGYMAQGGGLGQRRMARGGY